jgi:hypothetical protein
MYIYIYIVSFLYIMAGALIAFLYVLRGGQYSKGILIGWILYIISVLFFTLIFPPIVSYISKDYLDFFPEAYELPVTIALGWLPPLIVVIIAGLLHKAIIHFRPQSFSFGAHKKIIQSKLYLIIGLFCFLLTVIMFASLLIKTGKSVKNGRDFLLYKTDHKVLLDSCRELSVKINKGKLKPNIYDISVIHNQKSNLFPQLIIDLNPRLVDVHNNGIIDIIMSITKTYGVIAFPENLERNKESEGILKKYNDPSWTIELIDGLRYYDEDFEKNPEHKKEVEELLKKNKQP